MSNDTYYYIDKYEFENVSGPHGNMIDRKGPMPYEQVTEAIEDIKEEETPLWSVSKYAVIGSTGRTARDGQNILYATLIGCISAKNFKNGDREFIK